MITIIYSTHKDKEYNDKFNDHLVLTSGLQWVQVLPYVNHNEYSLSELYNKGIKEAKYDIVVCCHNDIKLEKNWGKKLLEDFSNNPEYGIIGKAGSCYFPESGVYWERMSQTMVGQVYHHPDGSKKWLSKYSPKLPFLIPVVTIDGLFISFDKTKIKHTFDESIGRFHFYDHLFCLPNYLDGVKIGVTSSFEITHQSVGRPNQEFYQSKELFLKKYGDKLPLDLKPEKIYVPEIIEKPIKNIGKMAVIIPTKGKVEMLFDCINSFYQHCNSNLFDVFIADTGSTNEEKEWIKNNILNVGNVKLIEFDYYNFAKINNEVVRDYIGDEYDFLLFCNNDIKLLNNVIYGMLKTFKEKPKTGTIGCRLHFEDNTIQHDGIMVHHDKNNPSAIGVTHYGLKNYYNYTTGIRIDSGSTGALLGVRKNSFIKSGLFNENYTNCFEDVELNLKLITLNYENVYDGSLVAYHYESQTRNEDPNNIQKLMNDYRNTLQPFLLENFNSIKKYINITQ
jgi:GT2 family glycosyltransferase